jgi:hypothetical protein
MACLAWHDRGWKKTFIPRPQHVVLWVEPDETDVLRPLVVEIEEWFASDEAHGWYFYGWVDEVKSQNRNWRFSDPNTAFAFKMRFG